MKELTEIKRLELELAVLKQRVTEREAKSTNVMKSGGDDDNLLSKCMEALQWATYHDGRYDQYKSDKWQRSAQELVALLATRLNRKSYEGFGT